MQRILATIFLTTAAISLAVAQTPQDRSDRANQIEQEVRQTIKNFDEAAARGDVATIESFIADRYFHTDIYGKVQDKTAWLESYFKPIAAKLKAGEFKWEIYRSDDIHVHVYGNDMAVAIGRWILKRSNSPQTLQGRFTHVWVKRQGHWQRVAYQATQITQQDNR